MLLNSEKEHFKSGICILPRGAEEGREVQLQDRVFSLRLGHPVKFHLVSSTGDTVFKAGELAEIDEDSFVQLPPIAAVLPEEAGVEERPVHLAAMLTEIGTLQVSCVATENPAKRWGLEFQLRGAGKASLDTTGALPPIFGEAIVRIDRIYGGRRHEIGSREARSLRHDLELLIGERNSWDIAVLRELFSAVWGGVKHRRRSADHERAWFNRTGFCLRPGYGYPLDDWRLHRPSQLH